MSPSSSIWASVLAATSSARKLRDTNVSNSGRQARLKMKYTRAREQCTRSARSTTEVASVYCGTGIHHRGRRRWRQASDFDFGKGRHDYCLSFIVRRHDWPWNDRPWSLRQFLQLALRPMAGYWQHYEKSAEQRKCQGNLDDPVPTHGALSPVGSHCPEV